MHPDLFLGSGQGAGDSMARWGFLSDALIRAYNKHAKSSKLTTPISQLPMSTNIQAFVDDSHGLILHDPNKQDQINDLIEHNMQTWEALLHAMGGKLEINKCQIAKFHWTYTRDGNHNLITSQTTTPIHITDSETKQTVNLPELSHQKSYKLLGIQMAFDGNQIAQATAFHQKCEALSIAFSKCSLSKEDTVQGYRSILLPKLRYGLSATNINSMNLASSQKLITKDLLPKLGFNRHTPSAIVYAPTHFGGIRLFDMTVEQGVAHINFLISHLRAQTGTATTIKNLLESYMIATGTITSPMCDTTKHKYIDSPWIETTKAILQRTNSTIITPGIQHPRPLRDRDQAIMQITVHNNLTTKNLRHINACSTWLQITTLSEITDITCTNLIQSAITGESDTAGRPLLWTISQSRLTWPQQPKPHKISWKHWRKLLLKLVTPNTFSLRTTLGQWHEMWHTQRTWHFSLNKSTRIITQHRHDGTLAHFENKRHASGPTQTYTSTATPPNNTHIGDPVTPITFNNLQVTIDGRTAHHPPEAQPTHPPVHAPTFTQHTTVTTPNKNTICIHNTADYEQQIFSWTATNNDNTEPAKGAVQFIKSRHCSPIR
jgi:hypothetical protein